MIEMRLRTRVAPEVLETMKGKICTDAEYDVLITGTAKVLKPDGKPLAIYLPGALPDDITTATYPTLHSLKAMETDNRGLASGTQRAKYFDASTRSRSKLVPSAIVGSFDPGGAYRYCRLTAWSGKEMDKYRDLFPLFEAIGDLFAEHVPDRYAIQMGRVNATHPDWHIGNTPFTTITVNNTYPTGVHTDVGDLEEGFSTLACLRRGDYHGGRLVFPEFRTAVDMKHGDVLLMDAHEWHGNTALVDDTPTCDWGPEPAKWRIIAVRPDTGFAAKRPVCDEHLNGLQSQNVQITERTPVLPMERISVVSYFRTKMTDCGSAEEEAAKAALLAEKRTGLVDEMAQEAAGATAG
jgi:hypothetical protein